MAEEKTVDSPAAEPAIKADAALGSKADPGTAPSLEGDATSPNGDPRFHGSEPMDPDAGGRRKFRFRNMKL